MANTVSTIASIGVSPIAVNVTIISDDQPDFRDNGGDLVQGDRWFSLANQTESIFIDGTWVTLYSTSK